MKSCPTCNRTYPDETLAFCLVDGSILSAPYDPQATLAIPGARVTAPPPTEISHSPAPSSNERMPSTILASPPTPYIAQPVNQPHASHPEHVLNRKAGLTKWVVIGAIIGAAAGALIGLILEDRFYSRSRYGEAAIASAAIGLFIGAAALPVLKLIYDRAFKI